MSKYTEKQKVALSLYRELESIWAKRRKLGYYKLKKPLQRGWRMQWRVRADILRSSDGANYTRILPYVQNYIYSRSTSFKETLELSSISEKSRPRIDFPDFFWTKYFYLRPNRHSFYRTGIELIYNKHYYIKRPYVYEAEIVKHFVDKVPVIDSSLDSRKQEIYNYLDKNNLWKVVYKFRGGTSNECTCDYCTNVSRRSLELKLMEKEIWETCSQLIIR